MKRHLQVLCRSGNWCNAYWVRVEKVDKFNCIPVQCEDRDGPHCRIRWFKVK